MNSLSIEIILVIFVLSFVSNVLPFAGAPYTLIATSFILSNGVNLYNLLIVIIVSGIGAALAKSLTYALGIVVKKPLKNNKNIPLLNHFINSKYFGIALFITAILPGLPLDDYLYMGGGLVRASLIKMLGITIPAKILKSSIEIPLEIYGIIKVSNFLDINSIYLSIYLSIAFIILGIILIKVDWYRIYEKYISKKSSR